MVGSKNTQNDDFRLFIIHIVQQGFLILFLLVFQALTSSMFPDKEKVTSQERIDKSDPDTVLVKEEKKKNVPFDEKKTLGFDGETRDRN